MAALGCASALLGALLIGTAPARGTELFSIQLGAHQMRTEVDGRHLNVDLSRFSCTSLDGPECHLPSMGGNGIKGGVEQLSDMLAGALKNSMQQMTRKRRTKLKRKKVTTEESEKEDEEEDEAEEEEDEEEEAAEHVQRVKKRPKRRRRRGVKTIELDISSLLQNQGEASEGGLDLAEGIAAMLQGSGAGRVKTFKINENGEAEQLSPEELGAVLEELSPKNEDETEGTDADSETTQSSPKDRAAESGPEIIAIGGDGSGPPVAEEIIALGGDGSVAEDLKKIVELLDIKIESIAKAKFDDSDDDDDGND
mmetsp:Transcript_31175/g.61046  ORF Transcript_31175/g.61046 Transcript_31175/m.61046 type:complete len:310 (-) Transcript_31175:97-1026(-)